MRRLVFLLAGALLALGTSIPAHADEPATKGSVDSRSYSRQVADEVAQFGAAVVENGAPVTASGEGATGPGGGGGHHHAANVQVNDPNLDNIQTFPNERPFEEATQSETSVAAFGDDVVIGYNSSANQPLSSVGGLHYVHRFLSGYSVSHDGGQTWTSGFVPPVTDSIFTFGDPALGVDRQGVIYYAGLAANAAGQSIVQVNRSTDHGTTFGAGIQVRIDAGSDKEWLAVGPDPADRSHDNVYVTWTSFLPLGGSELWFAKSTDGGMTWSSRLIFHPINQGLLTNSLQFSNPVVDASSGRLYVPFLRGGRDEPDYIQVLASDDAGATFHFLNFNQPGAPDPTTFTVLSPGTITDCGTGGGLRLTLHEGPDLGGGRGFPRFRDATRLTIQPSAAAVDGQLFIAFNTSGQPFEDPNRTSEIHLLYSTNAGSTWQDEMTVAEASGDDPQHVHPSITVDSDGRGVSIAYYVQQSDGKLRVDMVSGKVQSHGRIHFHKPDGVSDTDFHLTPSNIPYPQLGQFFTTNFDRTIRPCYDIGEYLSAVSADRGVLVAWGDNRNDWTSPPGSPAEGVHPQPDVFFQVK